MTILAGDEPCPCGGGTVAACCGPVLARTVRPATAEQLMRSRYTAFVVGDTEHLWRTWHPRTRPVEVRVDPAVTWTGLEVREVVGGTAADDRGVVAFTARFRTAGGPGELVERSRFARRGGRWTYVDGDVGD